MYQNYPFAFNIKFLVTICWNLYVHVIGIDFDIDHAISNILQVKNIASNFKFVEFWTISFLSFYPSMFNDKQSSNIHDDIFFFLTWIWIFRCYENKPSNE